MNRQPLVLKSGSGESMTVLGAQLSFLCTADSTGKAWSLMSATLPPDAGPPPHHHPWDEAYYVIEGEVMFSIDGRDQPVGAGDFIYAPAGTVHGFKGTSQQPARMLIFDAPAHAESFFREIDRSVRAPEDMARLPQIGQAHQVHFLPPQAQPQPTSQTQPTAEAHAA